MADSSKRILIVDDEPNVVKSCARMLELEGFEARGVTSGAEAIGLYKSDHFDLALVDIKMPNVDGLEVLAALKEYDADAAVVILTAYGTKETVVEALRLGACEFLDKPVNAETLVATVRRNLKQGCDTAVRGNLRTLSLPSIIQMGCAERNQACLRIRRLGQAGYIFFADGNVVHATLGSRVGEEAVYELLTWEDGEFDWKMGVVPPERTVTVGWSGLLLEGMRRIDERNAGCEGLDELELTEPDLKTMEVKTMATRKKADILADLLKEGVSASADIESGAVVGTDGMVLSAVVTGKLDEDNLGAQAAAFYGIAKRTSAQLERGTLYQAVIQSDAGNVVVTAIDEYTVFVGATSKDAVLGMVFREAREIAANIGAVL